MLKYSIVYSLITSERTKFDCEKLKPHCNLLLVKH